MCSLDRSRPVHFCLIALVFFCIYAIKVPAHPVGIADSDGFLAVGATGSLMQPPGYALYTRLLQMWLNLPLPATYAYKAHLFSAILHALTLGLLYLGGLQWLTALTPPNTPKSRSHTIPHVISLIGLLFLAGNSLYWINSLYAEKYPLNNLLTAASIWFLITISYNTPKSRILWLCGSFLLGTGLLYHQTFLLMIPAISFTFINLLHHRRLKYPKLVLISFASGLILQISLLMSANAIIANVNWHFPATLRGLVTQIARTANSGFDDKSGQNRSLFIFSMSIDKIGSNIPKIIRQFQLHWSLLPLVFFGVGTLYLIVHRRRRGFFMFLVLLIFLVYFPLIYVMWPDTIGSQAVVERWFLQGYVVMFYGILIGIWYVASWLESSRRPPAVAWLFLGTMSIWGAFRLYTLWPQIDLQHSVTEDLYAPALATLPKNALLMCDTDTSCFALLYLQNIAQHRPDVIVIPPAYPLVRDRLVNFPNLHGFPYADNPFLMLDYISWNLGHRPVFTIDLHPTHRNLLATQYRLLYLIPHGYVNEVVAAPPDQIPLPQSPPLNYPPNPYNIWSTYFLTNAAFNHGLNALAYSRLHQIPLAKQEIQIAQSLALNLDPDLTRWLREVDTAQIPNITPAYAQPLTTEAILSAAAFNKAAGKNKEAYFGYLGAVLRQPLSESARIQLAGFYEHIGDKHMAMIEYRNVLMHYPQNATADGRLRSLPHEVLSTPSSVNSEY